jgi:hypothetical protein
LTLVVKDLLDIFVLLGTHEHDIPADFGDGNPDHFPL